MFYERMGFKHGDFPMAERYYTEAISIPLYHGLTYEEQDYVVQCLHEVLIA